MSRRPRSTRRLGLAVIVLAVIVGAVIVLWGPQRNRWTAPDGTEATLQQTTFGKRHEYVIGGPLARLRRQLVQYPLFGWLGLKPPIVVAHNRPDDAVTFWFQLQTPTNRPAPAYDFWIEEPTTGLAARAKAISGFPVNNGPLLIAATFENYPRRQAELTVQLILWATTPQTNAWFSHRFHARNHTELTAGKLSALVETNAPSGDGLSFTLERVVTGLPSPEADNPARQALAGHTVAEFSIRENQQPSTHWLPQRIEARSATGNKFQVAGSPRPGTNGTVGLVFQETMWPGEAPWWVRVEFIRVGHFAPADRWHYHIPDVSALMEQSAQGADIASTNLSAGGTATIIGLRPGSQPGQGMELSIRLDGAPDDVNLSLVSARNAAGEELAQRPVAFSRGTGTMLKVIGLGAPGPQGSLDLVLAGQTNRYAEFIVTPELAP